MSAATTTTRGGSLKQAIDDLTGNITMYRLATLTLLGVAAAAVALSIVSTLAGPALENPPIPFTPIELLVNLTVALTSTVVSSRVLSLIFRTEPHLESSVITGLILFFLFWPTLDGADLATLAAAGTLATASKYLIAWRRRHILNPAAAGATLAAILHLNGSTWWVATGALLPFTVVGAFLLLYRTGRLGMGALFAAIAGTIIAIRLITGGQGAADAVLTTFTSYPIVFFAGFMLSEPLTMAPRRWQRLALAALIGILFTVPFTFGPVYLSFEFALVIGNVFAFLAGQRRSIRLAFVSSRQLTPTSWEFRFAPAKPVRFRPGQWMEFTIPHHRADRRGDRRIFSIASAPDSAAKPGATPGSVTSTAPDIAIAIRMPNPASTFKRALLELPPGQRLTATSVGGDFLLPKDPATKVLMIAGGIGVTPFLSQLAHDRALGIERDTVLVYEVSSLDELAFTDELAEEQVLLISPDEPQHLPANWRWIGGDTVHASLLEREVPDIRTRRTYVSGSPLRVNRARAALRTLGVRRVSTDAFAGY